MQSERRERKRDRERESVHRLCSVPPFFELGGVPGGGYSTTHTHTHIYIYIYINTFFSIERGVPARKCAHDLVKVLRLSSNPHLGCACQKIRTQPCKSAALATKSVPDLAKVLCLPVSVRDSLRCRAIWICEQRIRCKSVAAVTQSGPDSAKALKSAPDLEFLSTSAAPVIARAGESTVPATISMPDLAEVLRLS